MRQLIVAVMAAFALLGCTKAPETSSTGTTTDAQTAHVEREHRVGEYDREAASRTARTGYEASRDRPAAMPREKVDDTPTMSEEAMRKARAARIAAEQATLDRLERHNQQTLNRRPTRADFERELIEDRDEH